MFMKPLGIDNATQQRVPSSQKTSILSHEKILLYVEDTCGSSDDDDENQVLCKRSCLDCRETLTLDVVSTFAVALILMSLQSTQSTTRGNNPTVREVIIVLIVIDWMNGLLSVLCLYLRFSSIVNLNSISPKQSPNHDRWLVAECFLKGRIHM